MLFILQVPPSYVSPTGELQKGLAKYGNRIVITMAKGRIFLRIPMLSHHLTVNLLAFLILFLHNLSLLASTHSTFLYI